MANSIGLSGGATGTSSISVEDSVGEFGDTVCWFVDTWADSSAQANVQKRMAQAPEMVVPDLGPIGEILVLIPGLRGVFSKVVGLKSRENLVLYGSKVLDTVEP